MPSVTLNLTQLSPARNKMRSFDRILVLKAINGRPTDEKGMVDKRLFTGENKLHAIMDTRNCTWTLKYEMGGIPPTLKGTFTNFPSILKHAREYYLKRNIEITEVLD